MTEAERQNHTRALIKSFEQRNTRKDAHRIRLYREISRRHLGQESAYATPKVAFKFLACGALYVHMQCSRDPSHYKHRQPWQYCGLRFFCDGCALYDRKRKAGEWRKLIRWTMSAGFDPHNAAELEWRLPDLKDARNISRFSDYVQRTFQPSLVSHGIYQWAMVTAVDPILGNIRGLYLGSAPLVSMEPGEKGDAPLFRMEIGKGSTAPVVPSGDYVLATSGAWKPRLVRSIDLPSPNAPDFWPALFLTLKWVTESYLEPSDLDPAEAMELDRVYYRRRLYSAHGVLYGVKGIAELDPAEDRIQNGFQDRCPVCEARLAMTCEYRLPPEFRQAKLVP